MREVDIAIIGGGLGGLACANGMRFRGLRAHVYEAAPELRTSTSTVVGLSDNALHALGAMDPRVLPNLMPHGLLAHPMTVKMFERPDATPTVMEWPLAASGHALTFRWAAVQNVLAALLPEDAVHCSHRATGYIERPEAEGGGVIVHFKGQEDVCARFVVAADGMRSALRAGMVRHDPGPRYLGQMNWNAMLWNPGNSVVKVHEPKEMKTLWDGNPVAGNWKHQCMLLDTGSGYTFWQLRIMSPTPAFTTTHQTGTAPEGATCTNAGIRACQQDATLPQLVGGGLGVPGSKERVISLLAEAGFHEAVPAVEATPESDIFERAIIDRIPLDELGAGLVGAGGRLVLLGDAAHGMHPSSGQGGRTAFEDAHQLVEAFARHSAELHWPRISSEQHGLVTADISAAVSSELATLQHIGAEYEQARLARVCRIQRYVLEGQGLPDYTAQQRQRAGVMSLEDARERSLELNTWLRKYPACPDGDPHAKWWKPLTVAHPQ